MKEFVFKVSELDAGKRLDLMLAEISRRDNLGLSRSLIQQLIREGKVRLSGRVIAITHHKVKSGDEVSFSVEDQAPSGLLAENIPLDIVYEDEHLAVINKQPGLVVHPAPGNFSHTLVNALLYHFKKLSGINPERPGIVHRLDKETSGLLVIAKDNQAHLNLARQFARHTISRKYVALVKGRVEFDEGIIEIPIGRHPLKRKNMAAGFGAKTKYAKTRYRTLRRSATFSLLELEPYTGRTHQLRVHLAFLGHPILGDEKYGKEASFSRLALHAEYLGFAHPVTGKFMEFSSEIPKEFRDFIST
jgi:23S rRNA pseudouridine1911/1915/1917 synthase